MARYLLNLPLQLKQEAEALDKKQGVSPNQFIMWATAEKVDALSQQLDDPAFPLITYCRGASCAPTPVIRGTGVRVQDIVIAHEQWGMTAAESTAEYGLTTEADHLSQQELESYLWAQQPPCGRTRA